MSMYTQLLSAAFGQCSPGAAGATEHGAVDKVLRCRSELECALPSSEPDAVSAVLALEVAYDVALLQLAGVVGVESDPDRFVQPLLERARVEGALRERGISLEPTVGGGEPPPATR
jgi:hypothetical protein